MGGGQLGVVFDDKCYGGTWFPTIGVAAATPKLLLAICPPHFICDLSDVSYHRYLLRIGSAWRPRQHFYSSQISSLEEKTEESDENWHLPVFIHRTSATLKFLHAHSRESVATFIRRSKVQIAGPIVENYNLGVRYHDAHAVHTVHKCTFCPNSPIRLRAYAPIYAARCTHIHDQPDYESGT